MSGDSLEKAPKCQQSIGQEQFGDKEGFGEEGEDVKWIEQVVLKEEQLIILFKGFRGLNESHHWERKEGKSNLDCLRKELTESLKSGFEESLLSGLIILFHNDSWLAENFFRKRLVFCFEEL